MDNSQRGIRRWRRCRPIWPSSTPTPDATWTTPRTTSARPTRTTRATSDWPAPTGTTGTTTGGCGAEGDPCGGPRFNASWAWSEVALAELAAGSVGPERHRAEAARITAGLVDELYLFGSVCGLFHATDGGPNAGPPSAPWPGCCPAAPGLADERRGPDAGHVDRTRLLRRAAGRGRSAELRPDGSAVRSTALLAGAGLVEHGWLIGHGLRTQGRPAGPRPAVWCRHTCEALGVRETSTLAAGMDTAPTVSAARLPSCWTCSPSQVRGAG